MKRWYFTEKDMALCHDMILKPLKEKIATESVSLMAFPPKIKSIEHALKSCGDSITSKNLFRELTPLRDSFKKKARLISGLRKAIRSGDPAWMLMRDVAANPHRHNRWVHLACKRHMLDLIAAQQDDSTYLYDCNRARRPVSFSEQFICSTGSLAGQPLKFLEWQQFCCAMVYGWRLRKDQSRRRYQYVYIEIPRKNGKTGFVSPLGLYQLTYPPAGAKTEIYSVATKKDIAAVVWEGANDLLRSSAKWARHFRALHSKLIHVPTGSKWTPIGSDSKTLDGLRPEMAIMDELHAWPTRGLWDIFNSAFGSAFSPLIFQITTAGEIMDGICMEQRTRLTKILESVEDGSYNANKDDASFYFGCIWTIDIEDKWDNEDAWHKANPSLGTVKSLDEMRKVFAGAQGSDGARREFLLKQLNVWQRTGDNIWLDLEKWDECETQVTPFDYQAAWDRMRGLPCWFGADFSTSRDTTSLCAVADDPNDPDGVLVAWDFWLPGDELAARCNRDEKPYDLWAREHWLTLTEGNCIDINEIERAIVARRAEVQLVLMGYDPGYSQGAGIRLKNDHDFPIEGVAQGFKLSQPLQEIERLVLAGKLRHGGNPIARSHAGSAVLLKGDWRERLSKAKSKSRIDGIAALAMAMAARQESRQNPTTGSGMAFV